MEIIIDFHLRCWNRLRWPARPLSRAVPRWSSVILSSFGMSHRSSPSSFFSPRVVKEPKCGVETRKTYGRFGPSNVGVKLVKLAKPNFIHNGDVESPNIGLCHYAPIGRQTLPALQNHRCIPCDNCSKNRRRSRLRMNSSAQLCCSKNSQRVLRSRRAKGGR